MKKILIVDDERDIVDSIESLLKMEGYYTFTADGGLEGMKILNDEAFDLILLDVMMPELDGLGFLSKMRNIERYQEVPVILISASNVPKLDHKGWIQFVKKPFDIETILDAIKNALDGKA